jgi:hypothetical protein
MPDVVAPVQAFSGRDRVTAAKDRFFSRGKYAHA